MQRFQLKKQPPPVAGQHGKRGLPADWRWLKHHVHERDGWQCVQCGRRGALECDHKIPREAGGSDDPDNLQTLCRHCHIDKTRRDKGQEVPPDLAEWDEFMSLGRGARRWRYHKPKID